MAEQMNTETAPLRSGGLTSTLTVELHSHYAIRLWEGRSRSDEKSSAEKRPKIIGMPEVISRAGYAGRDAAAGNPYGDELLVRLEEAIVQATATMESHIQTVEKIIAAVPPGIKMSDPASTDPLNLDVFSRSPLGYRCVWLLIHYDRLALKTFQAFHYGLISRSQRDQLLEKGSKAVRSVYGLIQNYRTMPVTYDDIRNKTERGLAAISRLGEPDPAIMSGKKRSSFSSLNAITSEED
ncbi:TIGR03761 family integrating conjugative element protein [Candidatus Pantoea alvi]|uniref:PFL_4669 family integrating conjugative element protein n=1 Tax=Enterobacter agglomerans TaxID=549 RepID=UPI000CDDEF1D|nr:TIGR03761 family integrating conjugative element protein [Pantoea agglomerans]POW54876.1 TIGR03761 family integrating conjugative element protein [Pantoea alvi]UBN56521.1 TIGR03761 family integrating conjugative element protein [Pantoea agglomerans]